MNRLKELRIERKLLQKDVANILNIDQSNYSKYELCKLNVPVPVLKTLANFYETSVDYILYRTDGKTPYPKSIVEK